MDQVSHLLQKALPPGTFSFACQKRTRKAPATFEAREARTRGCSPLVTPKQKGSIQKIQVAPLEDFLCCADFESLRDGGTPTAADAASRYDLSRENAMPGGPQTARHCSIINNSSADDATATTAACGQRLPPVGGRCRIATKEGMQGGAVGAVASRMQGTLKGRSSRWVPQLVQSKAARILNRHAVVRLPAVPCPQTSAPQ